MAFLLTIFVVYSLVLYTSGTTQNNQKLSKKAINGQELWQKHNCAACHQFYGLGGYLGPDLTNIFSNSKGNTVYLKMIINSGVQMMPKFNFTDSELDDIITFFKEVDQTGYYPNKNAKINKTGWVEIEMKNKKNEK